jgi:uncharacterized Zn finger protein
MTTPQRRTMGPLVAAWKQAFHLASDGSGSYTKGLNLHRNGAVGQVHAAPGRLSAAVAAKKTTHKAALSFPQLTEDQWHALAVRLAGDSQATADLLAGRVPAAIADPGHAGGAAIVPGADDITFSCTCLPGTARRVCDHSAAIGHAVAERLASAASLLLAARGMPTRTLAAVLREHLADAEPGALPADAAGTVRADQTYSLWAHRTPPTDPVTELDPITPITHSLDDPPPPCPSAQDLTWLTQDAAARARALLDGATGQPHDPLADTVRILATPDGVSRLADAERASGLPATTLRTMMIGYRYGGAAGAHAALCTTSAPSTVLEHARDTIRASRALVLGNLDITDGALTDTTAGIQLRLGPDGRWYPFTAAGDEWRPAPGCSDDPADAHQAARRARAARPAA